MNLGVVVDESQELTLSLSVLSVHQSYPWAESMKVRRSRESVGLLIPLCALPIADHSVVAAIWTGPTDFMVH